MGVHKRMQGNTGARVAPHRRERDGAWAPYTAALRTNFLPVCGFDSIRILLFKRWNPAKYSRQPPRKFDPMDLTLWAVRLQNGRKPNPQSKNQQFWGFHTRTVGVSSDGSPTEEGSPRISRPRAFSSGFLLCRLAIEHVRYEDKTNHCRIFEGPPTRDPVYIYIYIYIYIRVCVDHWCIHL